MAEPCCAWTCRLRRARPAIDRLDAENAHQRRGMTSADHIPFGSQQVAQHTRPGEWKPQMQFVDPSHQGEIGR
jgi:hypothetical protein